MSTNSLTQPNSYFTITPMQIRREKQGLAETVSDVSMGYHGTVGKINNIIQGLSLRIMLKAERYSDNLDDW